MPPTPPHLAELDLTYATPDRVDDFLTSTIHGFHHDYVAEHWEPGKVLFEPERQFGFAVDGQWISTCGAYTRVMTVPGGSIPVAAVTFVTVSPSYRRRGLLRKMMAHQLADVVRRREPVALLWASESLIYGRFGYGQTTSKIKISGPTQGLAFRPGVELGPGSVGVVGIEDFLAAVPALHERWLSDRPGALQRSAEWWTFILHDPEPYRDGASAYRFALHYDEVGQPDGYALYRVKEGGPRAGAEVIVTELDAAEPTAYAGLWRFLLDLDLVRSFIRADAPVDEPLRYLAADPRLITTELTDGTYARIIDLRRALADRAYAADLDVILAIDDPLLPANDGAFRIEAGPEGAKISKSRRRPDVRLDIRELGAIYLGGTSLTTLQTAGLVDERTPGAVAAITAAFTAPRTPFCPDFF